MARRILLLIAALLVWPVNSWAQTTLLFLDSQPGDWVGGGFEQTFNEADGIFGANHFVDSEVSIFFHAVDYSHWWSVDIGAPRGTPLVPGVYEGATRNAFRAPGEPGLDVHGDGRGCNTVNGRFEVLEAKFSPSGDVISFAATFEQHCEGITPALFGAILFNANAPVPPRIELTLTGCTHCHAGDLFVVQGRARNPGTKSVQIEVKSGLRMPDGTGVSFYGPTGQHLVATMPPGLDTTFTVLNWTWPLGFPEGVWHIEATLLEPTLGRTFSRDVKVFEVEP